MQTYIDVKGQEQPIQLQWEIPIMKTTRVREESYNF